MSEYKIRYTSKWDGKTHEHTNRNNEERCPRVRRRAEEAVLERQRKDLIELADAELRRAGLL